MHPYLMYASLLCMYTNQPVQIPAYIIVSFLRKTVDNAFVHTDTTGSLWKTKKHY